MHFHLGGADVPGSIPKLHPYLERWSQDVTRKLAPSHCEAKDLDE